MRSWREAIAFVLFVSCATPAVAKDELAVDVINATEPTRCAEKDNVYLKLQSEAARRFRIEAVHPAYIGGIVVDRWAPDFTHCDMTKDPVFKFERRRLTIYETEEWQLVGITYPTFWRPNVVPVRVGDRTESGFHLLQLWTRHKERAEEVLVLYPADGYWRARPLPPQNLRWSAYGSSFLIGPVEEQGRPLVDIRQVSFDPKTRTFALDFVRGGSATLRLETLDEDRIVLDVRMSQTVRNGPFAALRSMYVTDINNDMAQVAWRGKDGERWLNAPVLDFRSATAAEVWAGRTVPSRHNTSAPDTIFRDFSATP